MIETPAQRAPSTLHLTNAYHAASGGIRTWYHALLEVAEADGRRMDLVVPSDGTAPRVDVHGAWTAIHHLPAPRAPAFDRRYRLLHPGHYLRPSSPIARLLRATAPAVVEVSDKYTLWPLARLLRRGWHVGTGRPTLVATSCERMDDNVAAWLSDSPRWRRMAHRYLRHVYTPSFDVHVANSDYTAAELRSVGDAVPVAVCGMGVDVATFAAARRDDQLRMRLLADCGGRPESVLVLHAGRLSPEKHLLPLIDAVALLAHHGCDARLVVAGDGPARATLTAHAARIAAGRVRFLGHVATREALATLCASADVFVHPNPREPFGIGPLEAMATGVPVVVANAGGVLSYAHDGNAWLAAGPHADGFAAAIVDAVSGRDEPRLQRARATAQAHAWPVMARAWFAMVDALHARRCARPSPASAVTALARS